MQTFLPYPDFQKSASVLDNKRLGKQSVECLQILDTLLQGPTKRVWGISTSGQFHKITVKTPWYNHPAVRMWKGYELILYHNYMASIVSECLRRDLDYAGIYESAQQLISGRFDILSQQLSSPPFWLGNFAFHASHRSNLLRKNPQHYSKFGWTEPDNLPYIWPI